MTDLVAVAAEAIRVEHYPEATEEDLFIQALAATAVAAALKTLPAWEEERFEHQPGDDPWYSIGWRDCCAALAKEFGK